MWIVCRRYLVVLIFVCQAEDGIRDLVRYSGLGDVYKRQPLASCQWFTGLETTAELPYGFVRDSVRRAGKIQACLLYTSDAADERSSVDLGGRRILKQKKKHKISGVAV